MGPSLLTVTCNRSEGPMFNLSHVVFALTGGTGREADVVYSRLASLTSEKWNEPYSVQGRRKRQGIGPANTRKNTN